MSKQKIEIWGAGISGLIAANVFQTAEVLESATREQMVGHKALLRFRSTAVADAVGIDFRKVRVHKGLWNNGHVAPSIAQANLYSLKVTGRLADRSIWNLDAVDRYIAPPDFVDELIERCGSRINWGCPATNGLGVSRGAPIISTIPMISLIGLLRNSPGMNPKPFHELQPSFGYLPITVRRWRIADADVFQSVYVTDPETTCYRISITGNVLIAEYIGDGDGFNVFEPFGINGIVAESLPETKQRFGKIAPINEGWRRGFILGASQHFNIFSLGRFATWRNILLDDVVHDIAVVKRLIAQDDYGRSRFAAK